MKRFRDWLLTTTAVLALGSSIHGATVGTFTGGDPGEGLDLQGVFAYAVNVGPSGAAGRVGDATFTADNAPGVTVTANNAIATGGWGAVNYGETANDQNLSTVMNSIRWAGAPVVVTVQLAVEQNVEYKLQLLFHEDCCPGRGYNIVLDGEVAVANFMPGVVQTGDGDFAELKNLIGSVVTHQFVADSNTYEFILDGPSADSPDISDRNAILNGFTLERITPVADSDADGMRDDWENLYFGDLSRNGTGDFDSDGLTDLAEFTAGTNPSVADSDGDGLSDGDEVNVHHTDPLVAGDLDGDGLLDGTEITVYGSNINKADTDDDGFNDYYEARLMTSLTDANSKPVKTLVHLVTGPDAGQGLDLDGNFTYAINAADQEEPGQIRDAYFTTDAVEGVTLVSSSVANNWNVGVNFGEETAEQFALSQLMASIRWSDANSATPNVTLTFDNLEVGASYKLQLLFAEYQWPRGFDVTVNGKHIVDDFAPFHWQGRVLPTPRTNGVAISYEFIANTTNLVTVLDGRTLNSPGVSDRNAILNGATLERVAARVDSDNDSLPDPWEIESFTNLAQGGTDDPDNDGLTNVLEFANGTNPNVADTDGDGLADGAEVNTHRSNPNKPDTDDDGLTDGFEVATTHTDPVKADSDDDGVSDGAEYTTYNTDPNKADTDGDGMSDGVEVENFLDPLKAEAPTVFSNVVVQSFFGGDPDEGLDLQGNFKYAFNVSSAGAAGQAGDANFTADNAPGIVVTAQNDLPGWATPEYGDTPADDTLEKVLGSIRWSAAPAKWRVELANLVPGSRYKLQVLVFEQCCATRGFNLVGDGVIITENFMPGVVHNGAGNTLEGAVVSAEFVTQRDRLTLIGDGPGATSEEIGDRNATLGGITLEILNEVQRPTLSFSRTGGNVVLTFTGELQAADTVNGTYGTVAGTSPLTVTPSDARKFYRTRTP